MSRLIGSTRLGSRRSFEAGAVWSIGAFAISAMCLATVSVARADDVAPTSATPAAPIGGRSLMANAPSILSHDKAPKHERFTSASVSFTTIGDEFEALKQHQLQQETVDTSNSPDDAFDRRGLSYSKALKVASSTHVDAASRHALSVHEARLALAGQLSMLHPSAIADQLLADPAIYYGALYHYRGEWLAQTPSPNRGAPVMLSRSLSLLRDDERNFAAPAGPTSIYWSGPPAGSDAGQPQPSDQKINRGVDDPASQADPSPPAASRALFSRNTPEAFGEANGQFASARTPAGLTPAGLTPAGLTAAIIGKDIFGESSGGGGGGVAQELMTYAASHSVSSSAFRSVISKSATIESHGRRVERPTARRMAKAELAPSDPESGAGALPPITSSGLSISSSDESATSALSVSAVPEPGAVSIVIVGAVGLLARRRRSPCRHSPRQIESLSS